MCLPLKPRANRRPQRGVDPVPLHRLCVVTAACARDGRLAQHWVTDEPSRENGGHKVTAARPQKSSLRGASVHGSEGTLAGNWRSHAGERLCVSVLATGICTSTSAILNSRSRMCFPVATSSSAMAATSGIDCSSSRSSAVGRGGDILSNVEMRGSRSGGPAGWCGRAGVRSRARNIRQGDASKRAPVGTCVPIHQRAGSDIAGFPRICDCPVAIHTDNMAYCACELTRGQIHTQYGGGVLSATTRKRRPIQPADTVTRFGLRALAAGGVGVGMPHLPHTTDGT